MKRLLIVDDELMAVELLERTLEKENFETIAATTGEEALKLISATKIDGVVLDWGLPDVDGLEILKKIRAQAQTSHLPVFLVTAKDDEIDTILALEMGADDYITKPFKRRELVARIKAVFNRMERDRSYSGDVIEFGHIRILASHRQVYSGDTLLDFGQKEFKLLHLLATNPNRIFQRDELLNLVWSDEVAIEERTVDTHIRRLRVKIETDPNNPVWIETVRGIGYRFNKV